MAKNEVIRFANEPRIDPATRKEWWYFFDKEGYPAKIKLKRKEKDPELEARKLAERKAKCEKYSAEGASFGLPALKPEDNIGEYKSLIAAKKKEKEIADKVAKLKAKITELEDK